MKPGIRISSALAAASAILLSLALPTAVASADNRPAVSVSAEQSDLPAPPSRDKRIIGAVHTDTVSAYLDDGALTLDSRADIDVTGDGVIDLGSRIPAAESLFHLDSASRTQVPDLAGYRFLGSPGSSIWMAPQTQNHELIWPGFSTEDPALNGRIGSHSISLRLVETTGPGEVELYLQNGSAVARTFSSREALPAWKIGVPQHTHMNWVFSAEGTYTLTFEASAIVDGRTQTARNDYVFVVGELASHQRSTATVLRADSAQVDPGEPSFLTAEIAPTDAKGYVQFREEASGAVLGSSPVINGVAGFRATSLPPGEHGITAEFVPTWSNDFGGSVSEQVTVLISGEVRPKPEADDVRPITNEDFAGTSAGREVRVTSPQKTVRVGAPVTVSVPSQAGEWLSVWIPELSPAWRGWVQADLAGKVSLDIPATSTAGAFRIAVRDTEGVFVGWDRFAVQAAEGGNVPNPPAPSPVTPPEPEPVAPAQQCVPGLVLDNGHIDAFTVSAGAGRAVLQIKEDVTGHNVLREVESVLLRVKPSAYRADIPAGMPGAPSGYVLPLTQNPELIWPGWDTNRTAASGYSDVSIRITGVEGPGKVFLSSQGSFGNVVPLLQSGGYQLPGVLREATPAHTHAQWVFEKEGIYKLRVHAVATNPTTGKALQTAEHTYVFQVGDAPLGDALCGLSSAGAADAAAVSQAVEEAAAEAVAAAQAAAAEEAELSADLGGDDRLQQKSASEDGADEESLAAPDTTVQTALMVGGALVIAGVVGTTAWHLRRLRIDARELLAEEKV